MNWRKLLWNFMGLLQIMFFLISLLLIPMGIWDIKSEITVLLSGIAFALLWFLFRKLRRPFREKYSIFGGISGYKLLKDAVVKNPLVKEFMNTEDVTKV